MKKRLRRQVFPECLFWILACSGRSDSRAREKNSRRKKKRGETRGGKGERTAFRPPPPVFPVYNLTRSLLTSALYYLNAWNRVGCLQNL